MIAEQLKRSVLQSAIQGKLTEQLPEDGNARDLLLKIQHEKSRLIKVGKLKRENPPSKIADDEIPFDIPESWTWSRIGEIFTLQAGKFTSSDSIHADGKYPCYGGNGIRGYVGTFNRVGRFPLIGRQGALCGNINIAEGNFYATEHAVVVHTYCSCIADWAAYFLKALNLNQYATATAQPGLSVNKVNQILFPIPPINEQKRILQRIDEILYEIDRLKNDETKLEALRESFPKKMKDSILQSAIQGKLTEQLESDGNARDLLKEIQKEQIRLIKEGKIKKGKPLTEITEDECPFDLPDNWCWVRIGDIFNLTMGQSPEGRSVIEGGNGIEFHQGKVFFGENYVAVSSQTTNNPSKIVESRTVVLCVRAPVGIVNVTKRRICIGRGLCGINTLAGMNEKFALYVVRAFKNDLIRKATGTTFPAITGEVVKNQTVPLPPLLEQRRIVDRLDELLPLCDKIQ